ncbi:MAG: fumarylacetoacetase [Vicinamibacterales bacterium]
MTSWIASANVPDTDFPLHNLPFGIFRVRGSNAPWRPGVAIGDSVLDLGRCAESDLLNDLAPGLRRVLTQPTLNALFETGADGVRLVRTAVQRLLDAEASRSRQASASALIFDADACEHALPVTVSNFSDFFASVHHARNISKLRDINAPLPPGYPYAPLAYHGRASSLQVSGTPVPRPWGPRRSSTGPLYAPTDRLDYEVELGLIIGAPSALGTPVPIRGARQHIAAVCLLNDWSARDVQSFESQPLGPFLSKSFATSISPWLVTTDALEPFSAPAAVRSDIAVPALPHLVDADDQVRGAWRITVECWLTTRTMRESGIGPFQLSRSDAESLFWTPAQLVTHHTSNGCNLQTGDVIGTGTLSGPARDSLGCLLEITRGGREPLTLPTGEPRTYLKDEDEITLRGYCSAPGVARIGFGECRGRVVPARRDL